MNKYRIWFDFAEKTRNKENKESDFESFKNIPVFMDIMEKLRTTTLSQDDFQYITDQAEYERGLAVYNEKVREEAREETWNEALLKYEPMILMLEHAEKETRQLEKQKQKAEAEKQKAEVEKQKAEVEKQKAEVEKQKAEVEKQKAEVEKQKAEHTLLLMIRKFLKKGDSVEDIAEFLELDMPTLEHFLEQIKEDDTINNDSKNT